MVKYIYSSDEYKSLLNEQQTVDNVISLIGAKSTILAQIAAEGITIPPTYTLTTASYNKFTTEENEITPLMWKEINETVEKIEKASGTKFGSAEKPLLLTCRGDSTKLLNGMLYSVVNIGMNDVIARGLEKTKNRKFAWESYARFIKDYGNVVIGIPPSRFDTMLESFMESRELKSFSDFNAQDWIEVTKLYKSIIIKRTGLPFPQDVQTQLKNVITSMYLSFRSERITQYRKQFQLQNNFGFSIIIQPTLFGNNGKCGYSAVVASRNPITGASEISGQFCSNATLSDIKKGICSSTLIGDLCTTDPNGFNKIRNITQKIEQLFKTPQQIDFVAEGTELSVVGVVPLQFAGTARFAAVRDMANSGIITKEDALMSFSPDDLASLTGYVIEREPKGVLVQGAPAAANVITGKPAFNIAGINAHKAKATCSILFKHHITPDDLPIVLAADAIVSADDGFCSFGARLLRMMRKTAIFDAKFVINEADKSVDVGGKIFKTQDTLTVGANGKLFAKAQKKALPKMNDRNPAKKILDWADEVRRGKMDVLCAVAAPEDAQLAVSQGADGPSYFPFESFITKPRQEAIRLFAEKGDEKNFATLEKAVAGEIANILKSTNIRSFMLMDSNLQVYEPNLLTLHEEIGVLRAMKEVQDEDFKKEKDLKLKEKAIDGAKSVQEANPLFGVRGVRLNIAHKALLQMQLKAIAFGAKEGGASSVRVIVPGVCAAGEIKMVKDAAKPIFEEAGVSMTVGAIIDNARGCMTAAEIAEETESIVISTTALMQTAFGMSAPDCEKSFLQKYIQGGYLTESPFEAIDQEGVGDMMRIAVDEAKAAKAGFDISVTGVQCGDPRSIKFCSGLGIKSIVCPPAQIPVAKLCAAQSVIAKQ